MITLNQLHDEWKVDQQIDKSALDLTVASIPYLHHKYWRYFIDARRDLTTHKNAYARARHLKSEYLLGRLDDAERQKFGWPIQPLKILRNDVDEYLDTDRTLLQLKERVDVAQDLADLLQDIIKTINQRNFLCKTILDYLKFGQGA
jgi:hypothetical protein